MRRGVGVVETAGLHGAPVDHHVFVVKDGIDVDRAHGNARVAQNAQRVPRVAGVFIEIAFPVHQHLHLYAAFFRLDQRAGHVGRGEQISGHLNAAMRLIDGLQHQRQRAARGREGAGDSGLCRQGEGLRRAGLRWQRAGGSEQGADQQAGTERTGGKSFERHDECA